MVYGVDLAKKLKINGRKKWEGCSTHSAIVLYQSGYLSLKTFLKERLSISSIDLAATSPVKGESDLFLFNEKPMPRTGPRKAAAARRTPAVTRPDTAGATKDLSTSKRSKSPRPNRPPRKKCIYSKNFMIFLLFTPSSRSRALSCIICYIYSSILLYIF